MDKSSVWSVTVFDDGDVVAFEPAHDWTGARRSVRQHLLDQTNIGTISHKQATNALRIVADAQEGRELTVTAGKHTFVIDDQLTEKQSQGHHMSI